MVKPVAGGSSVGMSIVRSAGDLQGALDKAIVYDRAVIVESYIAGTELTVGIIGNKELEALPIIEIIPDQTREFFDYEAKYTPGVTQEICPARIDDELTQQAQTYAKIAHKALYCRGYSRTDMILQDREDLCAGDQHDSRNDCHKSVAPGGPGCRNRFQPADG